MMARFVSTQGSSSARRRKRRKQNGGGDEEETALTVIVNSIGTTLHTTQKENETDDYKMIRNYR